MGVEETITLNVWKPAYSIGSTVYVPQKEGAITTKVTGYLVEVRDVGRDQPLGNVQRYLLERMVMFRGQTERDLNNEVLREYLYPSLEEAQAASRFIPVNADILSWLGAIGERKVSEDSTYSHHNSQLGVCCACLSNARDILTYCQKEKGLIVHEKNALVRELRGCGNLTDKHFLGELGDIFIQLEIGVDQVSC